MTVSLVITANLYFAKMVEPSRFFKTKNTRSVSYRFDCDESNSQNHTSLCLTISNKNCIFIIGKIGGVRIFFV
jgi:hypothetical protein